MAATYQQVTNMELQPLREDGSVPPHLSRNSRLTRSLFSSQQSQASRDSYVEREKRKHSLDRREKQLNEWTKECSKYMDAMLDTSRELKEREQENEMLRNENDSLKNRIEEMQIELEDYKRYNREQREQLSLFRQRTAQSRSEAEKFKVENMILASGNASIESYERLVEEHQQLRTDLHTMMRKSRETQSIIDQLQAENNALQERVARYEGKGGKSEDDNADPRSKRELMRVIRRSKEEKVRWEAYSQDLLRSIVTKAPNVLEIRPRMDVEHCCHDEARWEAFSLSLVQAVMESNPELLESVRTPTETDHEKLAHSRRAPQVCPRANAKVVSIV